MEDRLDEGSRRLRGGWALGSNGFAMLDLGLPARGHDNDRDLTRSNQPHLLPSSLFDEVVIVQTRYLVLEIAVGRSDGFEVMGHAGYAISLPQQLAGRLDRHGSDQTENENHDDAPRAHPNKGHARQRCIHFPHLGNAALPA
jgi:hypothetical protein